MYLIVLVDTCVSASSLDATLVSSALRVFLQWRGWTSWLWGSFLCWCSLSFTWLSVRGRVQCPACGSLGSACGMGVSRALDYLIITGQPGHLLFSPSDYFYLKRVMKRWTLSVLGRGSWAEFPYQGTTDIWRGIIMIFSIIPGFHPLDASSTPLPPTLSLVNLKWFQTLPSVSSG